jgi:tetratricopeptide (TPR) repeat protein
MNWKSQTKTNKKGEYVYIGLTPATYKITLLSPEGGQVFVVTQKIGMGGPDTVDFDMAKEKASAVKQQMANPESAKKMEADTKDQKAYVGLKQIFDEATLLFNQRKFAEAAEMYEKALPLAKEKNVPIVLARMADAYGAAAKQDQAADARKEHQQKAIETYQKALAMSPNEPTLHNNLGSVYAEMGKVDDAKGEFQKAADANPAGASGYYYNLGVVMVNQGKMDDAAVALKKATDLDPNNASAFYWYGMALMGKLGPPKPDGTFDVVPGTIEAFETYLKLQPNGQWAQAAKGSIEQLTSKVPTEYKKEKKKKT